MVNVSRGDYAYSLLDLETAATDAVLEELKNTEGMLKVRVVK